MGKLQNLKSLEEDRTTVKAACFYVGWHLLSPHNWAYVDIWTREHGEVSLNALINAVETKKLLLNPEKPKHKEKPMFTINKLK